MAFPRFSLAPTKGFISTARVFLRPKKLARVLRRSVRRCRLRARVGCGWHQRARPVPHARLSCRRPVPRCRVRRIAQGRLASPTRGCRCRRIVALYVF